MLLLVLLFTCIVIIVHWYDHSDGISAALHCIAPEFKKNRNVKLQNMILYVSLTFIGITRGTIFFSFSLFQLIRYWKSFKKILGLSRQIKGQQGVLARHWVWLHICWVHAFRVLGQESWLLRVDPQQKGRVQWVFLQSCVLFLVAYLTYFSLLWLIPPKQEKHHTKSHH